MVNFLSLTSGSGSDAANMLASARRESDHWVLNGTKSWITNGYEAKAFVCIAQADRSKKHKGITAFIVPMDSSGW